MWVKVFFYESECKCFFFTLWNFFTLLEIILLTLMILSNFLLTLISF